MPKARVLKHRRPRVQPGAFPSSLYLWDIKDGSSKKKKKKGSSELGYSLIVHPSPSLTVVKCSVKFVILTVLKCVVSWC